MHILPPHRTARGGSFGVADDSTDDATLDVVGEAIAAGAVVVAAGVDVCVGGSGSSGAARRAHAMQIATTANAIDDARTIDVKGRTRSDDPP
jgi:hypothetical protein